MVVVTAGTGGGTHKVLLISGGKQQQSSGAPALLHQAAYSGSVAGVAPLHQATYSRSISVVLPSSSSSSCQQSSDDSGSDSAGPPMRKRQRLTHLSPEEKALRRKLKNRVAAQTARDRKKAKMGELEQQVLDLELENQQLHVENRLLREKTGGLLTENEELRQRLGLDTLETKESLKVQVLLSSEEEAGLGIGSSESAAGAGPAPPKSEDFTMDTDGPDPTDAESDLLMGILDILDPELFLKSCEQQEECEEQEMLLVGGGHAVPAAAPAALGASPVKLEALNELIHFDHIYTKTVEEVEVYDGDCESDDAEVKIEAEEEEVEAFPVTLVVEVEEETVVCIKDEPQEVVIPECDEDDDVVDCHAVDFISVSSPLDLSGLDKEACLADAYSDSGYERSPSPFSDMSSPLMCSESSWEDMFANELFPQLISV